MTDQYGRTAERSRLGQARFSWRWSLRISGPDDDATQNSSLWRVAWLPVLLLLFTLACGREPGIIVNIAEWPDGVERIRVKTTIEGTVGEDIFLAKDQTRFAVRVPASSQGMVHLDAVGLDATDCKLVRGMLDEPVPDNLSRFIERTIDLSLLPARECIFGFPVSYAIGNSPWSVALGEFNGDLMPDLAVVNSDSNDISVLLGDGKGRFLPETRFSVGMNPKSVAVGDFNGDRKSDLAIANSGNNSITVMLGNGLGSFAQRLPNPTVTGNPDSIAVGDFNGDLKPDLAVTQFSSNAVWMLLGNGQGDFDTGKSLAVGTGPISVVVGDFNADLKPDLAVANQTSNSVSVLLGRGQGDFDPALSFGIGNRPYSVAVGDFNADLKLDLAMASYSSPTVNMLFGDGHGGFDGTTPFPVGLAQLSVAVGDFNGDLKLDLAVVNGSRVSVLLGNGMGGAAPPPTFRPAQRRSRWSWVISTEI